MLVLPNSTESSFQSVMTVETSALRFKLLLEAWRSVWRKKMIGDHKLLLTSSTHGFVKMSTFFLRSHQPLFHSAFAHMSQDVNFTNLRTELLIAWCESAFPVGASALRSFEETAAPYCVTMTRADKANAHCYLDQFIPRGVQGTIIQIILIIIVP